MVAPGAIVEAESCRVSVPVFFTLFALANVVGFFEALTLAEVLVSLYCNELGCADLALFFDTHSREG